MDDLASLRMQFGTFELDQANARLSRGGLPVPLAPKAFAVLCALARRSGRLVTKDELLDAVWGHQHVSDSVLKTTISELRAALGDDARQPRFIETAARRGYRFIAVAGADGAEPTAPTRALLAAPRGGVSRLGSGPAPAEPLPRPAAPPFADHAPEQAASAPTRPLIGRAAALQRLDAAWQRATNGQRQFFWIAGEAGVGKTTVIDNFVARLGDVTCVYGQCVEQFGAGEPFLPVLDALGNLCRSDADLAPLLRTVAPTWQLQMPWLSDDAERERLRLELAGTSPERMLRELGELLDRYTARRALLLVTEDLHWSDHATVRLIDHLARRRSSARLMWLGSFRLVELIAEDHPLKSLRHELRLQRLCDEIVLDPFSEQEVADYVESRLPATRFAEASVRALHARTEGLPLFVASLVEDLVSQHGAQPGPQPAWLDSTQLDAQVPQSLAAVIDKQISRLPRDLQALLEAASVCGMEFRPHTVAEVLAGDEAAVRERCDRLAQQQYWIRPLAIDSLPDGSLDAHYAFRHALYRQVFYQRSSALTRARLHRNAALSLERSRGAGFSVTAAELASHYELGHDPMAALRHYGDAADSALSRFAPLEAVNSTAKALALLPRCPEGGARLQLELGLVIRRGVACSQLLGMSSDEVGAAYERAQALCDRLPESPALGWALGGLGLVRYGRGEYDAALALGQRIEALAERHGEPALRISACSLIGMSHASLGHHQAGRQWLEQGIAVCNGVGERLPRARFFVDPGVAMQGHLAIHLLPLGLADQARAHADAALARGRALGHPMALALATRCAGMVEIGLRQPDRVAARAAALNELAAVHGIVQADGAARLLGGWAEAQLGDPDAGHAQIERGHAILQRLGMVAGSVQAYCYAIDALMLAKRWPAAQAQLEQAQQLARRLGEAARVPDLLLLQARIALGQGRVDGARESMHESWREARSQQALGLELAALVALCRLDAPAADDVAALGAACERICEGFDTEPVRDAIALRDRLGASTR